MNESEYQSLILEYARLRGWKRQHARGVAIMRKDGSYRHATPISGDEGYPDLTLVRRRKDRKIPQFAFIEVKTEKGYASDAQKAWLNEMVDYDGEWRSRGDVPDGAALHLVGGFAPLDELGDWTILVCLVRPRHKDWLLDVLA